MKYLLWFVVLVSFMLGGSLWAQPTENENPVGVSERVAGPFDDFLKYPVKSLLIKASTSGCGGGATQQIEYRRLGRKFVLKDSYERIYGITVYDGGDSVVKNWPTRHPTFSADELETLLRDFNEHYDQAVSWSQFVITDADLDKMRDDLYDWEFVFDCSRLDPASRQWARDTILQISDSLLTSILMVPSSPACTSTSELTIQLTNSHGEKLVFECYDGDCRTGTAPYMMPIKIKQKTQDIYSSYVPFMQFIATLMPKDMITHEKFTTHELLCKVARQLLK